MKNKSWSFLILTIFGLVFFTSLRIIAIYHYHLKMAQGNQTLAMNLMDKAHVFNLSSYITGGLHFSILIIVIMIILDK